MYPNMIDGQEVLGHPNQNINPSDVNDVIGEFAQATTDDVDRAIYAARSAHGRWSATQPIERSNYLREISARILAESEDLAQMLAREEGKPIKEARGEVRRAALTFRYFAGQLENSVGSVYQGAAAGLRVHTIRRSVGVVGIITPWNFPIAIPAWKIAPALAFGNTVIFKPADLVPGTAWKLSKIIVESGLPSGVFNLVMGKGSIVGQRLVESPNVDAITFTGSTTVGRSLARDAMIGRPKKLQLEMGGKNPLIILDDADLDVAVESALDGAFGSTGQRCTASSRLIVQKEIHDQFIERLCVRMSQLQVGDARSESTDTGPVASDSQFASVNSYIELGVKEGATIVQGGNTIELAQHGFYIEPTLFVNGHSSMRINQEEIFGPVACVISVDDYDEAMITANDVEYGLSAGIVTNSHSIVGDFQRNAQAGMIMVNRSTASTDFHVPFGGIKDSSFGSREQGQLAQDFFTSMSTIYTAGGGAW